MSVEKKFPRLYQRVRPAGAGKAQIVTGPKKPAILEIFPMVPVPDRFELLHGGVRKRSRVCWRRGIRIGVAF
jgi:hypothetical protein